MALLKELQTGLNAIYPSQCLSCDAAVDGDFALCGSCWGETAFVGGTVCDACGVPLLGEDAGDTPICDACMQTPRPWKKGRAALLYQDAGRKLVLALKHGDRQEIAVPAGKWIAQVAKDLVGEKTLIAPIPLHWQRLIKRRYNQSALLAKSVGIQLDTPVCLDLLQRYRRTRSLDGMTREQRFEMLKDTIRIHPRRRHRIVGRPILLIDDVMTSGATLAAATQACLDAGSGPVCIATLARVAKDA